MQIWSFFFGDRQQKNGPALEEFWGEPQDREQYAMERLFPVSPAKSDLPVAYALSRADNRE
jgi:hypothetical protein